MLRRREAELRAILDRSPDIVARVDRQYRHTYVNAAITAATGLPAAHFLGRSNRELGLAEPQVGEWERALDLAFTTGEPSETTFEWRMPDGTARRFHSHLVPEHDADGRVTSVLGFTRDVTSDARALARSYAELEAIYRTAPVGLCVLDREMRWQRINERLAEINGFPPEAHIGRRVSELLPDLGAQAEAALRRVVETGEPVHDLEIVGETASQPGVRRTWIEQWTPIRDAGGEVVGVSIVAEEVTHRRRHDEERERLLAITAALAAALTVDDVADALLREARPAVGADAAMVARLVGEGDELLEVVRATGYGVPELEAGARCPATSDGPMAEAIRRAEPVWVESRAAMEARFPGFAPVAARAGYEGWLAIPFIVGDGAARRALGAFGVAFRDARPADEGARAFLRGLGQQAAQALERARLTDAERAARQVAELASVAKSEFLATMSHELRTPLNAIQGYVQLLDMELHGPLTEAQRQALGRVTRAQQHLLGLINDVLNFARLEAGRVDYRLEAVEVGEVLRDVAAMVEPQVRAQGLAFVVRPPATPLAVRADAEKVRQVLLNLLGNSAKFTPSGGVVDMWAATPGDDPGRVHLLVRDTGVGIPAEKLEAVFEPFVQVSGGRTREHQGAGLGLSISRDLVRGMGGELRVASAPGAGSTFTVTLPRA